MNLGYIIVYFILGLVLFFILNHFDKQDKDNSMIQAIFPIIYITILAGIFNTYEFNDINSGMFFIVIFELIIRLYYLNTILKRENLIDYNYYFKIYSVSLLGSFLINEIFIAKVDTIFPTPSEMRMGVWFLIIIFLYITFKNSFNLKSVSKKIDFILKKREYVIVQYARLKTKYYKDIKLKNKELVPLVYAIMIYENYKRPKFYRQLDMILYRFTGKETKMGIMQIYSKTELTDYESINLSLKRINQIYDKFKSSRKLINDILTEYYQNKEEYITNIIDIYSEIILFDKN